MDNQPGFIGPRKPFVPTADQVAQLSFIVRVMVLTIQSVLFRQGHGPGGVAFP
jgi:hypothetical protein